MSFKTISTEKCTKLYRKHTKQMKNTNVWSKMLSVADEETNCVVYYNMKYYMRNNKYGIILFYFLKKKKTQTKIPLQQYGFSCRLNKFFIYIHSIFIHTFEMGKIRVLFTHNATTQQQYNTRHSSRHKGKAGWFVCVCVFVNMCNGVNHHNVLNVWAVHSLHAYMQLVIE